jgi:hypothetical protein
VKQDRCADPRIAALTGAQNLTLAVKMYGIAGVVPPWIPSRSALCNNVTVSIFRFSFLDKAVFFMAVPPGLN